ncbi:hypothetical protein H0H92_006382 [Tricholoma furcatifolium]|nr:hypothetical protein H0H92_006382 [Tricholoma furcatifolium]
MDPPTYLRKLLARFKALGGVIQHAKLDSLAFALEFLPNPPFALVNCTGLGSLKLTDVQDTDMYPVRGQVLVLQAPWLKEGHTKQVGKEGDGERTYVIPRRGGEVVIGGTREVDEWLARKGGLRLERGEDLGLGPGALRTGEVGTGEVGEVMPVVSVLHNVGHGGAGWQSCWGCAEEVGAGLEEEVRVE